MQALAPFGSALQGLFCKQTRRSQQTTRLSLNKPICLGPASLTGFGLVGLGVTRLRAPGRLMMSGANPGKALLQSVAGVFSKGAGTATVDPAVENNAPAWEDLEKLLPPEDPDAEVRVPWAKQRLFGAKEEEVRVILYRDNSAWCPYCERVWLQLEEKEVPYKVEKINMRCYGPKPEWYSRMVPSGLLPAMKLDGRLVTESMDIMLALEANFPNRNPLLPPPSSPVFKTLDPLLRLERQLFGAWLRWLTSGWSDAANRENFERAMTGVDAALSATGGPYFLGKEFSMIDAVYAPFLERIACSIPYWKGYQVRGNPKWPAANAWFDAMDTRPKYLAIKSDDFGIVHNLEPQIGACYSTPDAAPFAAKIDGKDGSWDLPLKPETTAWGTDDGKGGKVEAARSLVTNHEAVVGFALRGLGPKGEAYRGAVDVAFRYVARALLEGVEIVGALPEGLPSKEVKVAAAYLRDRVGVPRDMSFAAARQLRAHLHWAVKQL